MSRRINIAGYKVSKGVYCFGLFSLRFMYCHALLSLRWQPISTSVFTSTWHPVFLLIHFLYHRNLYMRRSDFVIQPHFSRSQVKRPYICCLSQPQKPRHTSCISLATHYLQPEEDDHAYNIPPASWEFKFLVLQAHACLI